MDPRMPLNQRNSPPISNNSHPSYMQPQMNKFGTNDQSPHTQQPLRPPNFQTSTRMGRNVATVGPLTGKIHQVVGMLLKLLNSHSYRKEWGITQQRALSQCQIKSCLLIWTWLVIHYLEPTIEDLTYTIIQRHLWWGLILICVNLIFLPNSPCTVSYLAKCQWTCCHSRVSPILASYSVGISFDLLSQLGYSGETIDCERDACHIYLCGGFFNLFILSWPWFSGFQSSLPPPMSASRFPSGQHLPDSAMMTPMPMSDGLSMPPMSNTSFYDNTFAVKPGPGGPGVPRPLPPQMQPQQPPFPPHHPLISPVSIQQPQSNSAMPMRALDGKFNFEVTFNSLSLLDLRTSIIRVTCIFYLLFIQSFEIPCLCLKLLIFNG